MSSIELKYNLFREIDSIDDETLLNKIASYIKKQINKSKQKEVLCDTETGCYANDTTMKSVEEVENGVAPEEAIDLSNFDAFKKSLGI